MPKSSESYNLGVLMPDLARQWHPTKNGGLGPKDVTPGSSRKVWWLCEKGHWWLARVCDRTRGMQCTFCRDLNKQGDQRMADAKPELLKEWHPSRNADVRARDVSAHHKDKVWWICGQGHEWEATIRSRLAGKGCPVCSPSEYRPDMESVGNPGVPLLPGATESLVPSAPSTRLAAWREQAPVPHNGAELRKSPALRAAGGGDDRETPVGGVGVCPASQFQRRGDDAFFRLRPPAGRDHFDQDRSAALPFSPRGRDQPGGVVPGYGRPGRNECSLRHRRPTDVTKAARSAGRFG